MSDTPQGEEQAPGVQTSPEDDDEIAKEMRTKCQSEFDKKASLLADQFNVAFTSQMSNMGDRYTSHTQERVTHQQTDVLRTNKVFREVSRDLGADWKLVFQRLVKETPQDKIKVEMARIERQKPFMQSFKALNTWKELAGDKFEIRSLVEALMSVDRRDLAEKVLDILENNEIDSLYALDSVGKGIAGGAAKLLRPEAGQDGERKPTKKAAPLAEDPVADRVLLKISKEFDKDWVPLAKALGIPDEEIEETKESSGDTYHGGFKSLFTWRDNQVESGNSAQESAAALRDILTKLGKADLAKSVGS